MLEITSPSYRDLTEEEKENVSDNGSGKEYANYIKFELDLQNFEASL